MSTKSVALSAGQKVFMLRFWFSAVALSATVMALCPTQLIHAAAWMKDAKSTRANAMPAVQLAQGHSPVAGGKGGGGLGGGAGMHGVGGGLGGRAGMHGVGVGMHGVGGGLGGAAGMHGVGGGVGGGAGMHGVDRGLGGAAGMHGVGGGLGGGPAMRALSPAGSARFVTPGMTPGSGHFATPGGASRFVIHQGRVTYGIRPGIAPHVPARPGVQRVSGAHYPRYRQRQHGFHHYHRGWWYAFPWWIASEPYYYGGSCEYRSNICASRWGYGTRRYHRCMRYQGCY